MVPAVAHKRGSWWVFWPALSSAMTSRPGQTAPDIERDLPAANQDDHCPTNLQHAGSRQSPGIPNLKQLGAWDQGLLYFEVVTTIALFIGLGAIDFSRAGVGVRPPANAPALTAVQKQTPADLICMSFLKISPSQWRRTRSCRLWSSASSLALRWHCSMKNAGGRAGVLRELL